VEKQQDAEAAFVALATNDPSATAPGTNDDA